MTVAEQIQRVNRVAVEQAIANIEKPDTKHQTILSTIGRTPIVRIRAGVPDHVEVYAKLEAFNPGGSVKDRLALGIIEDAERSGALKPGQTIVEATSGNTGIGLAMVCAAKGYPLVIVMAESFSVERRKLMRFLGAKVVLTPAAEKGMGMIRKAEELANEHGWFLTRQFENEANAEMHRRTTAPEILEAFEGERLDYWVSGFGTGGTLNGVASRLKQARPDIKIIACEPDNAPVVTSGHGQARRSDGVPTESHPHFRPHLMQGWSPDFISRLTEDALTSNLIDGFELIDGGRAVELSRKLAREEGILTGITGGATFAGALQIAEKAPAGSRILCMLPDTGERYLSTPLFDGIEEEMSPEEMAISQSTDSCRFGDTPPAPLAPEVPEKQEAKPAVQRSINADTFVADTLADETNPVVVFGLAWCEFGWSATKFLNKIGVKYQMVEIDRPEFQVNDAGVRVRADIEARSGVNTFPQVFVNGKFIGGCTDIFDAFKDGSLQETLKEAGIAYDENAAIDPYQMLPKWLHRR
ncbi:MULTISPECIES: cysteine synthase A [Kordiimonas]|jgi:cysteine synthase A|uniref:cysteine synthase A n=1 Tax=Kordiimonas TaxID=288021 RepID=UPI00257DB105|nr:cysteine synthase A [Kordiimonas sp. UBA4487]